MATIEEMQKMLDTAIGRISSLEGELRAKPKAAETPPFDIYKFRESLSIDPIGTMRAMNMNPDHRTCANGSYC